VPEADDVAARLDQIMDISDFIVPATARDALRPARNGYRSRTA
jgi:hypothetical protein